MRRIFASDEWLSLCLINLSSLKYQYTSAFYVSFNDRLDNDRKTTRYIYTSVYIRMYIYIYWAVNVWHTRVAFFAM